MKLYHYPNCSTCKKAIKFLNAKNADYQAYHIVETPPTKEQLKSMLESYDGNIRKLFNTSGMAYREMNIKEQLPSMSDDDAIDLLSTNGMLIKRPFLINDDGKGVVGFKEDQWESFSK